MGDTLRVVFMSPFADMISWLKLIVNLDSIAFLGPIPLGCIIGACSLCYMYRHCHLLPINHRGGGRPSHLRAQVLRGAAGASSAYYAVAARRGTAPVLPQPPHAYLCPGVAAAPPHLFIDLGR